MDIPVKNLLSGLILSHTLLICTHSQSHTFCLESFTDSDTHFLVGVILSHTPLGGKYSQTQSHASDMHSFSVTHLFSGLIISHTPLGGTRLLQMTPESAFALKEMSTTRLWATRCRGRNSAKSDEPLERRKAPLFDEAHEVYRRHFSIPAPGPVKLSFG